MGFNLTGNIDGLKSEKKGRVDPDTLGSETPRVRTSHQEVQVS